MSGGVIKEPPPVLGFAQSCLPEEVLVLETRQTICGMLNLGPCFDCPVALRLLPGTGSLNTTGLMEQAMKKSVRP